MLLAVKHHPQASAKLNWPIHTPQLPVDASEQPRSKITAQCCAAPKLTNPVRPGSCETGLSSFTFPMLWHIAFGQRTGIWYRASLALWTAQLIYNTGNPPMDNRELTAMLCWEVGQDHWHDLGQSRSDEQQTILNYLGALIIRDTY